jgi:hypothetical protein
MFIGDTMDVSNGVAMLHPRILPFDWDADGLLNEKDARPNSYDGDHFGNDNILPEGAASDHYCWIEITVSDAVARVTFAGDAPSVLPDPDFVARPGEAYRGVLLIGKTYSVSCDENVAVMARSSEEICVITDSGGNLQIVWPVYNFWGASPPHCGA